MHVGHHKTVLAASCIHAKVRESNLHPEAVSRQPAVPLAAAVGAAQRLDYLYQHGQGQAVGAETGAFFLFTVKEESTKA